MSEKEYQKWGIEIHFKIRNKINKTLISMYETGYGYSKVRKILK